MTDRNKIKTRQQKNLAMGFFVLCLWFFIYVVITMLRWSNIRNALSTRFVTFFFDLFSLRSLCSFAKARRKNDCVTFVSRKQRQKYCQQWIVRAIFCIYFFFSVDSFARDDTAMNDKTSIDVTANNRWLHLTCNSNEIFSVSWFLFFCAKIKKNKQQK